MNNHIIMFRATLFRSEKGLCTKTKQCKKKKKILMGGGDVSILFFMPSQTVQLHQGGSRGGGWGGGGETSISYYVQVSTACKPYS